MSRVRILIALACASVPAPCALADAMEPVVITATRTSVPLQDTLGSVEVISREEL